MPGHKDWLRKALSDLRSAKKLLKDDDDTLDTAAYHTQQCAEKALKAYLVFKHKSPTRTHDLAKLLELCVALDQSLKALIDDVITLIPYATYIRYPDDYFEIDRSDVEKAIVIALKIFKLIKAKIGLDSDQNLTIF
ncbi:MAG: HEPN domain-containing protein [bacterium]